MSCEFIHHQRYFAPLSLFFRMSGRQSALCHIIRNRNMVRDESEHGSDEETRLLIEGMVCPITATENSEPSQDTRSENEKWK